MGKLTKHKGYLPSIEKHKFTTDKPEACTAQISVRIPPSLKAELKQLPNWQEEVRNFLQERVKAKSAA